MCTNCLEETSEIDEVIFKIIDEASIEDMVYFANIKDDVIESVAEKIYSLCGDFGIDKVKIIIKKELKVEV
jgi:hypothetical protein